MGALWQTCASDLDGVHIFKKKQEKEWGHDKIAARGDSDAVRMHQKATKNTMLPSTPEGSKPIS